VPEALDGGCHISGSYCNDELVVTLAGEIDLACGEQVREFVRIEVDACPGVLVLDMSGVTFVDSTGLSLLVEAHRVVDVNGGKVVIRGANQQFRKLLDVTCLDEVVVIEEDPRQDSRSTLSN
jgi:stage II sporulation protein AA (anti-sigma F factor antagonist)